MGAPLPVGMQALEDRRRAGLIKSFEGGTIKFNQDDLVKVASEHGQVIERWEGRGRRGPEASTTIHCVLSYACMLLHPG